MSECRLYLIDSSLFVGPAQQSPLVSQYSTIRENKKLKVVKIRDFLKANTVRSKNFCPILTVHTIVFCVMVSFNNIISPCI